MTTNAVRARDTDRVRDHGFADPRDGAATARRRRDDRTHRTVRAITQYDVRVIRSRAVGRRRRRRTRMMRTTFTNILADRQQ
jgi:hypothetical protein